MMSNPLHGGIRVALIGGMLASAPLSAAPFSHGERETDLPPAFEAQFRAPVLTADEALATRVIVDGLEHPWGIAPLPNDIGYLVTERAGRLRHVSPDGTLSAPIEGVPEVLAQDQGGLLDVALGPDFASDREVFLTYAKPMGEGRSATAAARGRLSDDLGSLENVTDIFVQEPASPSPMHFGSRVLPDDDGHAWITTGEHFTPEERRYAQDLDKTYGKVVRVNTDGSIPDDNPFVDDANALDSIWSLGHRNMQGAAFDADGRLFTIEHGPRGGDELNRPEAGLNYGWPVVSYGKRYGGAPIGSGEAQGEGFEQPLYFWDPVIAPGGMAFHDGEAFGEWNGDLLIGALVAGGVVRLEFGEDGRVSGEARYLSELGRVRDVQVLDDGSFLLLTDKPDGELVHVTPADAQD